MNTISKVFPDAAGQPVDHPMRLEALRETGLLDSLPEESFDRYTRLAKILLGAEVSLVSLVDESRQFFKSQAGMPEGSATETPLSHSFCKHVVEDGQPFMVDDARHDPRVEANPAVEEYGVASYLGMPLRTRDGMVLGSLCVFETRPRKWSEEDQGRLSDLAAAVMREIELSDRTAALKDSLTVARKAEQEREEQLRMTVHDLRTPAGAVSSCLDLLMLGDGLDEEQVELLQICKESTDNLLTMVQGILAADAAAAKGFVPERTRASASLLVRRMVRMIQPLADDAGIRLDVNLPDEIIFLSADEAKVERVLVNLVTNALKYSPVGRPVTIEVRTAGTAALPMCRIAVYDEGPGVPEVDQQRIFLHREKGPGADGRGDPSFGIGLAFCQRVVDAHGGEIGMTNRPDGGSEFYLMLPVDA